MGDKRIIEMYTDRHLNMLWQNAQRAARYEHAGMLASDLIDTLHKNNSSRLAKLKACWTEIIGQELEGLCFPLKLKSDILTIAVYNSDVRFYLEQFHRRALLERICEILGVGVRDIRCVVDDNIRNL